MEKLQFDLAQRQGPFKCLNAVNGGPIHKRHATDQFRTNFETYAAARIPYNRNHDAARFDIYGGPYAHDIDKIFRNFDADACDPESYDFENTDEAILTALDAGSKTFFRLGQSIEHHVKKHGTLPPKDFKKWAVICEHIIRHYTEGWKNGLHLDMPYWEIWNEPDLDPLPATHRRTWGGTDEQFFDLYEITAKHLKSCFPHLKIGGPSLSHRLDWAEMFLEEMHRREVPIDFFTWHCYHREPERVAFLAEKVRALLDAHGYGSAESILNEWGYLRGWRETFVYTLEMIHGIKGAAYMMAVMSVAQKAPLDMLMYYCTLPHTFNGAFDFYTLRPLKGYYPLKWYGSFYDLEAYVPQLNETHHVYSLCGVDAQDKAMCVVTCYNEDDAAEDVQVAVDFGRQGAYEVYLLDEDHDGELLGEYTELSFTLKHNACLLIKEK